ncbi:MAG: phosphate ABC transporter permease [Beggiatoa sp. IS2]|nr:MAG: phosphate ABC transporter permease [Beggiatoa sp. IS2]
MTTPLQKNSIISSVLNTDAIIRHRKWRMFKDKLARYSMTAGGISIIVAIVLIFFYLLYVVLPLLKPASIKEIQQLSTPIPQAGMTLHLVLEEKNEIAVRLTDKGHAIFFQLKDGTVLVDKTLPIPAGATISSFAIADPVTRVIALGLSNGQAIIIKHAYTISYPNDIPVIKPDIEYPLGEAPIIVDHDGQPLTRLGVQLGEEDNLLIAVTADHRLVSVGITRQQSLLNTESTLEYQQGVLPLESVEITHLLSDKEQKTVYLASRDGQIWRIDVKDKTHPQVLQRVRVVEPTHQITALRFLTGDISLLIGDSSGRIAQWFVVRDENNNSLLTKIREFHDQQAAITHIMPEEHRKGFLAVDNTGQLGIYHATAHRTVLVKSVSNAPIAHFAISPRADVLLLEKDKNTLQTFKISNKHPEISWSALWGKVWYESHEKPKYMWQSSSASEDFEPKFSLTPLAFGTFKAAFYAMLVAIPLAILGAIYTAYFISPATRKVVKPVIEIMAALPTVILGFLGGLWLAPTVENNLPGMFLLLIMIPSGVLLFAYFWPSVAKRIHYPIHEGWEAVLLIPVILLIGWWCFAVSQPIEVWLFNGNTSQWLTATLGMSFDQRNALIVGMVMGLAVIPNIFSIAEDAIFSVPKHLTAGSLALGATRWQTMTRVVLLTASPGIFSAIMIGLGRAVGETMIVLMSTGNTPIMDFSMFQGLRTLSANIAVEMPESEVNSTHFRVLFLSGMVLFLFTFFFNTLAEVVRHRLRRKYSSL